jgi:hypothetical protein
MARSEARISVSIWDDADFLVLSSDAQRLFLFLCSQSDLAHDGVIALRERRWSKKAAGLTLAAITRALTELESARFVVIDEDAEELLVRSFIRRDKVYRQPNVLRAAADHLKSITSHRILTELAVELERIAAGADVPSACGGILAEMRSTVGKGTPNPSGNPSPGTPGDGEGSGNPSGIPTPNPSGRTGNPADDNVSAGVEGSGNPSRKGIGNPTPGTLGERGMVTAVSSASPSPVPRASGPRPRPSAGGRASAREAEPTTAPPAPPSDRCPKHLDDPDPPNCGRCAGARKARARWEVANAERRRTSPQCRTHRGQPAHNCALCRADQLAAEETP